MLLYGAGRGYGARKPVAEPASDVALVSAVLGVFWGVSGALYLEQRWTRPLWRACGAASGRDWMINSGLLRLDWRRAGPRTHAVGLAIFLTYPLWLLLGMRRGRAKARGHA